MGIRDRLKDLVKTQVKKRISTFETRGAPTAPPPPRSAAPAPTSAPPVSETPSAAAPMSGLPPISKRRLVRAPQIHSAEPAAEASDGIRIKARANKMGNECTFLVDRPVLAGRSWWFDSAEEAAGSPLAEAIFALEGTEGVLIDDSTVVAVAHPADWREASVPIGATIRTWLESGQPAVNAQLLDRIPAEDELRARLQTIIDDVINPGVASHSGHISLARLRGNSVFVQMGGGCQGCSAAAITLKQGIFKEFRAAVPEVGAIYDATDHSAGQNPFFS